HKPCCAGQRVRVLKHVAELASRLHRRQRLQRELWRHILELEQPFEVLPRQACARADQVFHEYAARRVGVSQLERWQEGGYWRVPRELPLVDELPEHQRR